MKLMWYKQIQISEKEKNVIGSLFKNLKLISIDNYINDTWKVLYFHSIPFIEESIYQKIFKLMLIQEFAPIRIFCYPFSPRTKFLCIEKAPRDYNEFNKLMEQNYFIYTGGFGYSQNEKVAFVSNAEIDVFSIGFDPNVFPSEIKVKEIPQMITKNEAEKLVKEHLDFLAG